MSDSRNEAAAYKTGDPHPVHNSLVFVQYNPCGQEVWTSIAGDSEAPYRPHVMPPGSSFDCDFRFPPILLSPAKSICCKTKKDSITIAVRLVQPLTRIHRNRQRPPSNGSIERAQSASPDFTLFVKTRLR
jgi:hypothetical protein